MRKSLKITVTGRVPIGERYAITTHGGLVLHCLLSAPTMSKTDKSRSQSRNKVRVIAGKYRSRQISFADRPGLRPTGDRIRETLFNWLQLDIAGARCLDLFAGSGILGIESLSRDASWVDFVDADRRVCQDIKANLELLQVTNASVQCVDALEWLARLDAKRKYDVLFLDPPFDSGVLDEVLNTANWKHCLNSGCKMYVECDYRAEEKVRSSQSMSSWIQLKHKRAGDVSYSLYQYKP